MRLDGSFFFDLLAACLEVGISFEGMLPSNVMNVVAHHELLHFESHSLVLEVVKETGCHLQALVKRKG